MTCCGGSAELAVETERERTAGTRLSDEEIRLSSRSLGNGLRQTDLSVLGVHWGACIRTIESTLMRLQGVEGARVNLSTKRVSIRWRDGSQPPIGATLSRLGYAAHLFDDASAGKDGAL